MNGKITNHFSDPRCICYVGVGLQIWKTDEKDGFSPNWDSTVTKHLKGDFEKVVLRLMDEDTCTWTHVWNTSVYIVTIHRTVMYGHILTQLVCTLSSWPNSNVLMAVCIPFMHLFCDHWVMHIIYLRTSHLSFVSWYHCLSSILYHKCNYIFACTDHRIAWMPQPWWRNCNERISHLRSDGWWYQWWIWNVRRRRELSWHLVHQH